MEKMLEQLEVGFDPQKSFAQVHEDGNMENRIGVQVVCLNTLMKEKTAEEIRGRNPKTTKNKILKNNGFLVSVMLTLLS